MRRADAFTLPEALIALAVLLILAGLSLGPATEAMARQRLESATRRVLLGLERGRLAAERSGIPCALRLDARGWHAIAGSGLAGCSKAEIALEEEGADGGSVRVEHNLPVAVRFNANGLVLDGGTVVLSHPATALARCVVVSLPLGGTRVGLYGNGACQPDPAL